MYIFGYGSLVDIDQLKIYLDKTEDFSKHEIYICKLNGYKRIWNVAMDNSKNLENYKFYKEKINEELIRPSYFVTFLNIQKDVNYNILGILFYVNKTMLEKLILRERNYDLIEISKDIDINLDDKVFAFIAKKTAIERFNNGLHNNKSIISKEYFDFVKNSYLKLENNKKLWSEYFCKEYNENFVETYEKSMIINNKVLLKNLIRFETDNKGKELIPCHI
jgi:cation transport regulator ChaC